MEQRFLALETVYFAIIKNVYNVLLQTTWTTDFVISAQVSAKVAIKMAVIHALMATFCLIMFVTHAIK